MGVILTVDQGNSSVKYSIFDCDSRLLRSSHSQEPDLDVLPALLGKDDLDGVIFASVAGIDARFVETLRLLSDESFILLTPSTPVPLKNKYESQSTLGVDRLAAAVGASALYPGTPLLIADAGTALTLDLLSAEPAFCGGTISPGIEMRLNAMHQYTARLPKVEWKSSDKLNAFPLTTADALRCGAVEGVVDQITATFAKAKNIFPDCRLLLTGGDADALSSLLEHLHPLCVPALVAHGLNRIFRYNETIS